MRLLHVKSVYPFAFSMLKEYQLLYLHFCIRTFFRNENLDQKIPTLISTLIGPKIAFGILHLSDFV